MKNLKPQRSNLTQKENKLPVRCDNYITDEQIQAYLKTKGYNLNNEEFEKIKDEIYVLIKILFSSVTNAYKA